MAGFPNNWSIKYHHGRNKISLWIKGPVNIIDSSSSSDEESKKEVDLDYEYNITSNKQKTDYPNTTSFAMRHGVSNYIFMGMINMVLRDTGELDHTKYVSRKKVRNMQERLGNQLAEEHSKNVSHKAIVFDGKKNYNAQKYCQSNLEENISVISEPGGWIPPPFHSW